MARISIPSVTIVGAEPELASPARWLFTHPSRRLNLRAYTLAPLHLPSHTHIFNTQPGS